MQRGPVDVLFFTFPVAVDGSVEARDVEAAKRRLLG